MTTAIRSDDELAELAEDYVIGGLLDGSVPVGTVREALRPFDLSSNDHALLLAAVFAVDAQGGRVDPLTVAVELQRRGQLERIGGRERLGEFIGNRITTNADDVDDYLRIIDDAARRRSARRALKDLGHEVAALIDETVRCGNSLDEAKIVLHSAVDRVLASPDGSAADTLVRAIDAPEPQPIEWLIDGLWPVGEIGLIAGDGGSFKSTAAIHVAAAVAGGHDVFDRFRTRPCPALIVSAEDSQDVVILRLRAIVAAHGWNAERVLSNVHVLADPDACFASAEWQRALESAVRRAGAGLTILDPWAELLGGDENSNSENRPALKFCRTLARRTGTAVGIVHHTGKPSTSGVAKGKLAMIRGASAIPNAARTILYFDYAAPSAINVSHLKNSRGERQADFAIRCRVDTKPGQRSAWTGIHLVADGSPVQAGPNRAEQFVIAQVMSHPRRTTTELKSLAKGTGVSAADVSGALVRLQDAGRIGFEGGQRGMPKYWIPTLPNDLGKVAQQTLPTLPEPCRATPPIALPDLAPPLGGQAGSFRVSDEFAEVA